MNEMFSGTEVRLREALSADEAEPWRQQRTAEFEGDDRPAPAHPPAGPGRGARHTSIKPVLTQHT